MVKKRFIMGWHRESWLKFKYFVCSYKPWTVDESRFKSSLIPLFFSFLTWQTSMLTQWNRSKPSPHSELTFVRAVQGAIRIPLQNCCHVFTWNPEEPRATTVVITMVSIHSYPGHYLYILAAEIHTCKYRKAVFITIDTLVICNKKAWQH